MSMIICKIFFYFLCFYWRLQSVNRNFIFGPELYLSQKRSGPNLKVFRYRIWTCEKIGKVVFRNLVALILDWNCLKSLIATKLANCPKIKFEGDSCKLDAKDCFQGQSWTKYMRQTLVSMSYSAIRKNLISTVQQFSASIKKLWV